MASSFTDINIKLLGSLSPDKAISLFTSLLWCSTRRLKIPTQSITISGNVNVPDGGIDAHIAPNATQDINEVLVRGNSFYQLKAGMSATPWQKAWLKKELFGDRLPKRENLGEAVRYCLSRKGRYILVCFGCDPTETQRRQAIRHLRDFFKACGYKSPKVDFWGQGTLGGLIEQFPSISLRLSDQHHLPFLTYDDWRLDGEMKKSFHIGKLQQKMVEQVRGDLRGNEIRHVRLIGEPGLGKTRLVLEALAEPDLASAVLYFRHPEDFQQSPLFNSLMRSDDLSIATIVIDDCPARERASIWNAIRQRSDRLKLVTLDHGPEDSTDEWMRVIQCPVLEKPQIKEIIKSYIGGDHDTDRWAEFCSGSPRVAHAVGDNLRRNPSDVLKSPATVPIWDRFVHGNSKTGSQEEVQREIVLRHVALFHKFGFESPVDNEAKFIASLVEKADPSITWARFESITKHFRDRRILQGKTTLFIVPRALHIHLWLQYWEHFGRGTDIANVIAAMPDSLFRWFAEMFKYGHASVSCVACVERLTSQGGPFDNADFIMGGKGALFLDELAEAHPEAALNCIERTIGQWSQDELLRFTQSRQHLVWALEKIAIWKQLFARAAKMLLKLAAAENANNSNNALGTFCGLFAMGYDRMATSEASPSVRLPSLEAALGAVDQATRAIGLQAAAQAIADHPHSKMIGPEHQGIRPLPKLWMPKTYGEIYDAYRASWRLVVAFWRTATGDEKANAATVLTDAAFWLMRERWMADEVLSTLEELRNDPTTNLRPLVVLVARYRMLKWHSLSRKAAAGLRKLDERISGTTLESRIRRTVLLGTYDDTERDVTGKRHYEKLTQLAHEAMADQVTFIRLIPQLVGEQGFTQSGFGFAIGQEDHAFELWPTLVKAFFDAGDSRNPDLIAGYLNAMFVSDTEQWETVVLSFIHDSRLRQFIRRLVLGSGVTERIVDALCSAIEQNVVDAESLSGIGYGQRQCRLSTEKYTALIAWCARCGTPDLIDLGLETAYQVFVFDKDAPPIPEEPLLSLVTARNAFEPKKQRNFDYTWSEVTKHYIIKYPHNAIKIFRSVLDHFDNFDVILRLMYSQAQAAILDLVRLNPKEAWAIIAERLGKEDDTAYHLAQWLEPRSGFGSTPRTGPLSLMDPNDVLSWVDIKPTERAPFIMRACPKALSPNEGGNLTRELLIRYHNIDGVSSALQCNFGSEGWSGKASEHHRKQRDEMRNWLINEHAGPVIRWIEGYIDYLGRRIDQEEMREERDY